MTTPDNAQPEALRLADWIDSDFDPDEMLEVGYDAIAKELRRQHAEIQQIKAQNAHLRDALSDIASGEIMRSHCVGPHCTEELGIATADELSSRAAGALNWDDLVAQPSTDVGIPMLAQLSARQAVSYSVLKGEVGMELFKQLLNDYRQCLLQGDYSDAVAAKLALIAEYKQAASPPPQREPLTDEQILRLFIEMYGQEPVDDITEFAEVCGRVEKHHGIGAAND